MADIHGIPPAHAPTLVRLRRADERSQQAPRTPVQKNRERKPPSEQEPPHDDDHKLDEYV
jgi:hypothetical protein